MAPTKKEDQASGKTWADLISEIMRYFGIPTVVILSVSILFFTNRHYTGIETEKSLSRKDETIQQLNSLVVGNAEKMAEVGSKHIENTGKILHITSEMHDKIKKGAESAGALELEKSKTIMLTTALQDIKSTYQDLDNSHQELRKKIADKDLLISDLSAQARDIKTETSRMEERLKETDKKRRQLSALILILSEGEDLNDEQKELITEIRTESAPETEDIIKLLNKSLIAENNRRTWTNILRSSITKAWGNASLQGQWYENQLSGTQSSYTVFGYLDKSPDGFYFRNVIQIQYRDELFSYSNKANSWCIVRVPEVEDPAGDNYFRVELGDYGINGLMIPTSILKTHSASFQELAGLNATRKHPAGTDVEDSEIKILDFETFLGSHKDAVESRIAESRILYGFFASMDAALKRRAIKTEQDTLENMFGWEEWSHADNTYGLKDALLSILRCGVLNDFTNLSDKITATKDRDKIVQAGTKILKCKVGTPAVKHNKTEISQITGILTPDVQNTSAPHTLPEPRRLHVDIPLSVLPKYRTGPSSEEGRIEMSLILHTQVDLEKGKGHIHRWELLRINVF